MLDKRLRSRYTRTLMVGLLGVIVGACVFGLPALASTSHAKARYANTTRHNTIGKGRRASADSSSASVQAAATAAVQNLVNNGTIDQHQAAAIDSQIDAGTVDPSQLVASGLLTESQMQAVNTALVQVKQSFAGSTNSGADKGSSARANQAGAEARLHAATNAAVEALVDNGTIDQHQADVIDSQVDSGVIDPGANVASGLVTQSQMQAVGNALAQVKRSFATAP